MKNIIVEDVLLSEVKRKNPYVHTHSYPEIVAYTVQGNHLTQDQYLQEINIALRQIEQGKTIADEDLQKEMETW
jgi:hypothetical protein